jgi:hypothetical protein
MEEFTDELVTFPTRLARRNYGFGVRGLVTASGRRLVAVSRRYAFGCSTARWTRACLTDKSARQ